MSRKSSRRVKSAKQSKAKQSKVRRNKGRKVRRKSVSKRKSKSKSSKVMKGGYHPFEEFETIIERIKNDGVRLRDILQGVSQDVNTNYLHNLTIIHGFNIAISKLNKLKPNIYTKQ